MAPGSSGNQRMRYSHESAPRHAHAVCSTSGPQKVWIPQLSASWLRVSAWGVNASTGVGGRHRDDLRLATSIVDTNRVGPVPLTAVALDLYYLAAKLLNTRDSSLFTLA